MATVNNKLEVWIIKTDVINGPKCFYRCIHN
jgi:hypothetical protein